MKFTDCSKLSANERTDMFGKGFATVLVTGFCVEGGEMYTRIATEGNTIILVGDPERALHNYLLGKRAGRAQ